jgi:WD40 repeat protein
MALADKLLVDGEFKVLASGGEDCTIRLWSMSTRAKSRPLVATFHGHEKSLSFLSAAWYVLSNYQWSALCCHLHFHILFVCKVTEY